MLLTTIHWPDEIKSTAELDLPEEEPELKPAEKKMAAQLIEAMTGEFDPAAYRDEYREALMQVIESKIEGRETVEVEPAEEPTKLVDLMAALQASVNAATSAREAKGGKPVSVAEATMERAAALAFIQHQFDAQGVAVSDLQLIAGGVSLLIFGQRVELPIGAQDGALVIPDMLGAGSLELLTPLPDDPWRVTGATITANGMVIDATVDAGRLLGSG